MSTLLLIDKKGKKTLINSEEKQINTQYGIISESNLNKFNGKIKTHKGIELTAVKPSFQDIVEKMKMGSRPIYPYDSGIMAAMLSIKKGTKVLEAGTGSGGNTSYLAELGAEVDTWEKEKRFYDIAEKNLKKYKNVKTHYGNVIEAEHKKSFYDVIFLINCKLNFLT
jgi:tRNA (adenine57-N1/adenine58-N1)-methyltransferase